MALPQAGALIHKDLSPEFRSLGSCVSVYSDKGCSRSKSSATLHQAALWQLEQDSEGRDLNDSELTR